MITTKIRGHLISTEDGINWYYEDGELYEHNDRPCASCGVLAKHSDPDPCLGMLPGVDFACCGHGDPHFEYVKADGIRFDSVLEWEAQRVTISATSDN